MKKTVSFAAALIMTFGSTAVYAFAEETTNEQDIAVEQVLDEVCESELYASAGKVDAEQNALARKAKFSVEIAIRLKDGSTISTGWKADNVTKTDKGYALTSRIATKDYKAKLTAAGKTVNDADGMVFYITASFDKSLGIDDSYRIKYHAYTQGEGIKKDGSSYLGYAEKPSTADSDYITTKPGEKGLKYGSNGIYKDFYAGGRHYLNDPYKNAEYFEDTVNIVLDRAVVYKADNSDSKTIMGDANGDKKIDVADIAVAATHIKGIKALTSEQIKAVDVNKDNNVNVADIAMIASHIKGIKALK